MAGRTIIVMGVCASGKSTIAEQLAISLNARFIDGDDLHPPANIDKMSRGEPLDDADRAPWLDSVADAAHNFESKNETGVIVCSALKKHYRDRIRQGNRQIYFVYLHGDYQLILQRIQARSGHFMKQNMVDSQFAALEIPLNEPNTLIVDINHSVDNIVSQAVDFLQY